MNKLAVSIGQEFFGDSGSSLQEVTISSFVSNALTASISISGIILLFILIGGGIAIIQGAGSNDPQAIDKGKKAATGALIGFIVVFSAYWIVKLIEQLTGLPLIGNTN